MNIHLILALLAIVAFLLAALGADQGKGLAVGLIFLTLLLVFS